MADENVSDIYNECLYEGSELIKLDSPIDTLNICYSCVSVSIIIFSLYLIHNYQITKDLLNFICLKHIYSNYFHVSCIFLYNIDEIDETVVYLVKEVFVFFDLIIPLYTLCLSVVIYLRLFFNVNSNDLYNKKQISGFVAASVSIVEVFEFFFVNIADETSNLEPALRVATVLLAMSGAISLFLISLVSLLRNNDLNTDKSLLFVLSLMINIFCDLVLLFYNLNISYNFKYVFLVLLFVRVEIQIVWFVGCNIFFHNSAYQ